MQELVRNAGISQGHRNTGCSQSLKGEGRETLNKAVFSYIPSKSSTDLIDSISDNNQNKVEFLP